MKRSELKRTPLLRKEPMKQAKPAPRKPREKSCAVCRGKFVALLPLAKVCSPGCAIQHAAKVAAAQRAKVQRQERAADKAKREGMKTYPQLIREAQKSFNEFIRLRDRLAGYACISSGRPLDWSGNATDAGHFRSTGSAPHLRFNEDNCHAQSKHDNRFLSGSAVDYRLGLIARIGLARVEALEADNTPRKWTHEELRAIKAHYQRRVREMKRSGNAD